MDLETEAIETEEVAEDQETTEETEEVESEEEVADEEAGGEDKADLPSEPAEQADEEYADEAEYLAQFELGDDINSVEDVVNAFKAMSADSANAQPSDGRTAAIEAKLAEFGITGGIDNFLTQSPNQPATQPQNQTPYPTFSSEIDSAVHDGDMNQDMADYFKPFARRSDKLLNNLYSAMEHLYSQQNSVSKSVNGVKDVRRDLQWNAFAQKGNFERTEIDSFMKKHNYSDYDSAARAFMASDPKKFAKLMNKLNEKSSAKATKKLRLNKGAIRKGQKAQSLGGPNHLDYYNPNSESNPILEAKWDNDVAAGKVKAKDWDKVTDRILKEIKKSGR